MPRRRPFTLPLRPAEAEFLRRLHAVEDQALADAARGDFTLVDMLREDVRDIMRRKHDALSHPHSEQTKARIAAASRARVRSQARNHRGQFS